MSVVKKYLSLVKFSHTIFAMPFALIGFALGLKLLKGSYESVPPYDLSQLPTTTSDILVRLILVVLCMVFARSAAMAFNRYLDRHFDALNPRTAIREIPAGILHADHVLWFTIINALLFMASAWLINRLCFYLSPIALIVVLGYSFTKRFTSLCHLILGLGLSLAPIGAYLAMTGVFAWLPILFSLAVIGWVAGFDIIYALQDESFDRENKLFSIPVAMGRVGALRVSEVLHLCSASCIIIAGYVGSFGWVYVIGAILFCGMLLYQHRIVKPNDLSKVNIAFMTANGIASVVFAVFVIIDLIIH